MHRRSCTRGLGPDAFPLVFNSSSRLAEIGTSRSFFSNDQIGVKGGEQRINPRNVVTEV